MSDADCPSVPVSWGELLDKLTILAIKRERITRADALLHVEQEHALLSAAAAQVMDTAGLAPLMQRLTRINATLWEVEDALREQEADAQFGPSFVALARSVYKTNDERAAIKRAINDLLGSALVEEKSYAQAPPVTPVLVAQPAH
ncbi:DUF6165 family protein [Sphingomonas turrisvirgatae]|uniref:Uncharacterized protein n=1 Tax=Sphingomonas turrisvirgatae TaxID=1888892 RepID=A0A1E3LRR8_9SPHN|nr:DUF6165 family protein [Sphingomonas turrisvirgatae]ODP36451.1 hypothetical protein BFL28_05500 [Sphingomonas turrisvirgatae]